MKAETKAALAILIREIQECKDMAEVGRLLECWKKANDLHPEKVEVYSSMTELKKALGSQERG